MQTVTKIYKIILEAEQKGEEEYMKRLGILEVH